MTEPGRPNLVFVLTDDHGAHAVGSYGSVINETLRIDELADRRWRFDNCFVTTRCAPRPERRSSPAPEPRQPGSGGWIPDR